MLSIAAQSMRKSESDLNIPQFESDSVSPLVTIVTIFFSFFKGIVFLFNQCLIRLS